MSVWLAMINPEALGAPRGFSHGVLAPAGCRLLFVAGQVAARRAWLACELKIEG